MSGGDAEWFDGLAAKGIRPGLEGISSLLSALGNPQKGMRFIHVAGSDGKGSVCSMAESVLLAAGYKAGMFTTPHIISVNECIRFGGKDVSDDEFGSVLSEVRRAYESSGSGCTGFEVLTACAFLYFRRMDADIAVIEVGMGGRLDATNVIVPEVTVINSISTEHTAFLGSTIEEIASEKAGIMKPGVPCITINSGKALEMIEERASSLGCPMTVIDPDDIRTEENRADSILFRYMCRNYETALAGRFQGRNAALAIEALSLLKDSGSILPFVRIGLKDAVWHARMEKLPGIPVILDVTHTAKGAECLASDVSEIYGRVELVTGMLNDKNMNRVAEILSPVALNVYVSAPDSPRAASPGELSSYYRRYHNSVTMYNTIGEAAEAALRTGNTVLVTGSFRTAEDFLRWQRTNM